jgi:hypothetical protein
LLAGNDPVERVSARLKRILDQPIERNFNVDGQSVRIPFSVAWSLFSVTPSVENLNRQIHDFVASQGVRDEELVPA